MESISEKNDNVKQSIEYIPVMYCFLPETRKGSQLWSFKGKFCPEDINNYILQLKEFLSVKNILIRYNESDNAFTILVQAPVTAYDLITNQCKRFNNVNEKTPFIETYYFSWNNKLNFNREKVITLRKEKIKSYFDNSSFIYGLCYPENSNICNHSNNKFKSTTKYRFRQRSYGINSLKSKIDFERCSNRNTNISGTFEVFEEKEYDNSLTSLTIDKGIFTSQITINEQGVKIKTNSEVARIIQGKNYSATNVRDGLFSGFPNETDKGVISITEYYRLISNGTRLLHYSDSSEYFEIFELPNNWFIENGISGLGYPKVFNNIEYDKNDKDLNEIYEILNSRQKANQNSKILTKKI